jgi:hypothetical protein
MLPIRDSAAGTVSTNNVNNWRAVSSKLTEDNNKLILSDKNILSRDINNTKKWFRNKPHIPDKDQKVILLQLIWVIEIQYHKFYSQFVIFLYTLFSSLQVSLRLPCHAFNLVWILTVNIKPFQKKSIERHSIAWHAVCTRPEKQFTFTSLFKIASYSNFISSSCRKQFE